MYLNTIISWIFQEYSKKLQRHELMRHYLIYQVRNEFGYRKQLRLQVKENFSKKYMQKLTVKYVILHTQILSILNVSNNSSYIHKQQTPVYIGPRYKQQLPFFYLIWNQNPSRRYTLCNFPNLHRSSSCVLIQMESNVKCCAKIFMSLTTTLCNNRTADLLVQVVLLRCRLK